ncbi:MAG: hypothetical protein FJ388_19245, partial [Verrucomicrobia bacterium]|nr:hypothetical protein [Verrucomicrobiota bacterium]
MALGNDRKALGSLQTKLLALLPAPETTHDARDLILRAVQRMGFCNNLQAVAALLTDAKLSHMARLALEGIKDSRVDDAFLAALPKAQGDAKVGLVISLGLRRCAKAVPALLPLKDLNDAKLAGAALTALGRIGTPECAKALQVPAAPALEFQRQSALAACMNLLRDSEAVRVATTIFEDTKAPAPLRAAAIRVLMRNDEGKATAWFAKAMADNALRVRETAIRVAATELSESEALIAALPKAAPEDQVRLLGTLAERRERRAGPAAAALLKSSDGAVQQAAARALADVGGPEQVVALAELLAVDDLREAVMAGLSNMRAEGAGQKIAELTAAAEPQQRSRLVAVIAARAGKQALPELAKYINDSNDGVRKDTWRAIREVAQPGNVETCLGLLAKAQEADRSAAEQVLVSAMRLMTPEERGPALVAAWNRSDAAVRPSLARIMAYFADAPCATPLIAALDDKTPAVQEAAVRALSGWPDAKPMEPLCAKALLLPTENLRSQAVRGAVRMIAMSPGLDAKARLLDLFRKSPDASGRAAVAAALGERLGLDAFGVLESLFDDAQVGASARKAYIALYDKVKNMTAGELDRKSWKANASHSV